MEHMPCALHGSSTHGLFAGHLASRSCQDEQGAFDGDVPGRENGETAEALLET